MTFASPAVPSPHDRRRIAVIAGVTDQTVARVYRGDRVRSTVAARVVAAARNLGLPVPTPVLA
jgi:DNA-binding LacI/PurR family transcriptional regulator